MAFISDEIHPYAAKNGTVATECISFLTG